MSQFEQRKVDIRHQFNSKNSWLREGRGPCWQRWPSALIDSRLGPGAEWHTVGRLNSCHLLHCCK